MSNLLGSNSSGSNSSSGNSYNQAYGTVSQALGSTAQGTGGISSLLTQLLTGQGGGQAYQDYQNSTGFQNQVDTGSRAITDNAASKGLLQSGSTGQALEGYGVQAANQNYNSYLSNLLGAGQLGVSAANGITAAGQVSQQQAKGKTSSKTGLGL